MKWSLTGGGRLREVVAMRELTVVRLTDLATGRAEEFFSLGGARGAWRSASERRASKT